MITLEWLVLQYQYIITSPFKYLRISIVLSLILIMIFSLLIGLLWAATRVCAHRGLHPSLSISHRGSNTSFSPTSLKYYTCSRSRSSNSLHPMIDNSYLINDFTLCLGTFNTVCCNLFLNKTDSIKLVAFLWETLARRTKKKKKRC